MIEEYCSKYEPRVDVLGRGLASNFRAEPLGEYEHIYVMTKEDKVIGFVKYSLLYEVADILYIVVDEKFRRLGIASDLIEKIESNRDVERMMLEVRVSNEEAISFYQHAGFTKVRPIANYYKDGEDAIVMEKVIR